MKKILNFALAIGVSLYFVSNATAYNFDIQTGGSAGSYDIWYMSEGDTIALEGYSFSFVHDGAGPTFIHTPPAGLSDMFGGIYETSETQFVFSAARFGGSTNLSGNYKFANISFAVEPTTLDWDRSSLDFIVTMGGVEFAPAQIAGGSGKMALADTNLKNSAAVPLPGAAWLLGTGLCGLLGFRRKHSA